MDKKHISKALGEDIIDIQKFDSGMVGEVFKVTTVSGLNYVMKTYTDTEQILSGALRSEFDALDFLFHSNFPVPEPIRFLEVDEKEYILMEEIKGPTLAEMMLKEYRPDDYDAMVKIINTLHEMPINILANKLGSYPESVVEFVNGLCDYMEYKIAKYKLDDYADVMHWLRTKASSVKENKMSILHMDFQPFNIIMSKGEYYLIDIVYQIGDGRYDIAYAYNLLSRHGMKPLAEHFLQHYHNVKHINEIEDFLFFRILSEINWIVFSKAGTAALGPEAFKDIDQAVIEEFNNVLINSDAWIRREIGTELL